VKNGKIRYGKPRLPGPSLGSQDSASHFFDPWENARQERKMTIITIEEAQSRLSEIINRLTPGEEVILTQNSRPVARIVAGLAEKPQPIPGRCKGMLTIVSDDDEHLKDFAEYMP
jgi:prevent-host-death family protein